MCFNMVLMLVMTVKMVLLCVMMVKMVLLVLREGVDREHTEFMQQLPCCRHGESK